MFLCGFACCSYPSALVYFPDNLSQSLQFGLWQGENGGGNASQKKMKYKKNARNLQELYEKKHGEQEKDRIEREAMMQAKKEEREAAEARRRALKEKMYKKTRSGQPVMKYRIEHMLEAIQGSTS